MEPQFLIGIEPTRHCNIRCTHCLRHDTRTHEELPFELFVSILDQARAYGRPHIGLTGGEPTLHRRFFEMLDAMVERDFSFHFVTNGVLFSKMASRLRDYSPLLRSISFSIDGASEETHDSIRGTGNFRRVVTSVAMARHMGFDVTVQTVVCKPNFAELGDIVDLCDSLGVGSLFFCHAQPTQSLYEADWQLTPAQWRATEERVRELGESAPMRVQLSVGGHNPGAVAPCMTLQHRSLNIDYRGRLTLCCQLSGVSGDEHTADVIADLQQVSLAEAHGMMITEISGAVAERVRNAAAEGTGGGLTAFECWSCQKRYDKIGWMNQFSEDPWVTGSALPDPMNGACTSARSRRQG